MCPKERSSDKNDAPRRGKTVTGERARDWCDPARCRHKGDAQTKTMNLQEVQPPQSQKLETLTYKRMPPQGR